MKTKLEEHQWHNHQSSSYSVGGGYALLEQYMMDRSHDELNKDNYWESGEGEKNHHKD